MELAQTVALGLEHHTRVSPRKSVNIKDVGSKPGKRQARIVRVASFSKSLHASEHIDFVHNRRGFVLTLLNAHFKCRILVCARLVS